MVNILFVDVLAMRRAPAAMYIIIPHANRVEGGVYWFYFVRPYFCQSIRLYMKLCPLHNLSSTGGILFILGADVHCSKKVCAVWLLTLIHIFKVICSWLRQKVWQWNHCAITFLSLERSYSYRYVPPREGVLCITFDVDPLVNWSRVFFSNDLSN